MRTRMRTRSLAAVAGRQATLLRGRCCSGCLFQGFVLGAAAVAVVITAVALVVAADRASPRVLILILFVRLARALPIAAVVHDRLQRGTQSSHLLFGGRHVEHTSGDARTRRIE